MILSLHNLGGRLWAVPFSDPCRSYRRGTVSEGAGDCFHSPTLHRATAARGRAPEVPSFVGGRRQGGVKVERGQAGRDGGREAPLPVNQNDH
jgi:hypothetical protein